MVKVATLQNFRDKQRLRIPPVKGHGHIYLLKPNPSLTKSKGYIGRTIQPLAKRLINHVCKHKDKDTYTIHKAMHKYGLDNFDVHIVDHNVSIENLPYMEKKYVEIFDTFHNGYNETEGGEVAPMECPQIKIIQKAAYKRPEVQEKMRNAGKRRWQNPEYVERFKAGLKDAYTPEVRAHKSEICKKQRQNEALETISSHFLDRNH